MTPKNMNGNESKIAALKGVRFSEYIKSSSDFEPVIEAEILEDGDFYEPLAKDAPLV